MGLRHAAEAGRVAVWVDRLAMESAGASDLKNRRPEVVPQDPTKTVIAPVVRGDLSPVLPFAPEISDLSANTMRIIENFSRWAGNIPEDSSGTVVAPMAARKGKALPFEGVWRQEMDTHEELEQIPPTIPKPEVPLPPPLVVAAVSEELAPMAVALDARTGNEVLGVAFPIETNTGAVLKELPGDVERPAMMGPLAKVEDIQSSIVEEIRNTNSFRARVDPAKMSAPVILGSELPLERFPLEKCAEIAASIGLRRSATADILRENELTLQIWRALDEHWAREIRKEIKLGGSTKLEAYDAAYVAQLERERGPILPEEYAQIVVGAERGNMDEVFRKLRLPVSGRMRIERVWMRKQGEKWSTR